MLLAAIIISILLNGFFSGIEIAFISANKLSIELKKKQGRQSGFIISHFLDHPTRFIGTCLVGFNIFLVIYGLIIGHILEPFWNKLGPSVINHLESLKLVIEVLVSTAFVLVIEYIFKAIFRAKSDAVLHFFASPMNFFNNIFGGIAQTFVAMAEWILKYIFNISINQQKEAFSRGDLEHYYQQTKDVDEENQELNTELFENALSLPSVKVRSCLVPRREVVGVNINTPLAMVKQKMIETKLSRIVVYDGSIDNISGYIHQLDLFKQPLDIKSILLPMPVVPESMSATDLINKLSRERKSIAWVVDEFGGTSGIVTMEDVLEEIFGEIRDEYDTEEFVEKQLSDNEYIFSGRLKLDDLNEKFEFHFPENGSETLSGYIIQHHENMPKQNEKIILGNYQFDIMNMCDTRIELVKMKVLK